ncbi:MAG: RND family transporter, partial [Flavobacteriales bacterium]
MWLIFARIIIRKRIFILALIMGLTGWFAYNIQYIQINRELTDMLPPDHPDQKLYKNMRKLFGQDGMMMVIAVQNKNLYEYNHFKALYELGHKLRKIDGVDSVFSEANMYSLEKDAENKKFVLRKTMKRFPATQAGVDSIRATNRSLPFYENVMFNPKTNTSLVLVFLNADKFNSADRGDMVTQVTETGEMYVDKLGDLYYSGLPLIRDTLLVSLRDELSFFVFLSVGVSALILYFFFRSLRALFICMLVILIGLIWSFGTMAILGYKITTMMSLIPPLMIIIGIPNCIYLINKYHQEYVKTRNKMKALTQVIHKLGVATFITNANTALGFLTFVFTGNHKLLEFGVVSALNVMAMFFVSLTLIPIIFTFMAPPTVKHVKHLEKSWTHYVINKLVNIITYHRKLSYTITIALTVFGLWGIFHIKTTGNIASDLPSSSDVVTDLAFLEKQFGGVMPMEVIINTKEKGQITKEKTLLKIDSVQRLIATDPIYSKSLSVVDAAKFINQAFRGGFAEDYAFVSSSDKIHIAKYIKNSLRGKKKSQFKSFIDSTETITRITANMADVGTLEIKDKQAKLATKIDSIINPFKSRQIYVLKQIKRGKLKGKKRNDALFALYDNDQRFYNKLSLIIADGDTLITNALADDNYDEMVKYHGKKEYTTWLEKAIIKSNYDVHVTGASTVFALGTNYMINDMIESLIMAIIMISALMFFLFTSARMIIISLVPNIIPQILVAGIMGWMNIPIKPSTILVFSLAYGISVDNSIHFLAKYRQELRSQHFNIRGCVAVALRETFLSQVYTSIVLLLGFSMFCFSDFGGTVALGLLVSLSLLIAMFCNLIVLPALLMTLDRYIAIKAYEEPFLSIYDEEEDID